MDLSTPGVFLVERMEFQGYSATFAALKEGARVRKTRKQGFVLRLIYALFLVPCILKFEI